MLISDDVRKADICNIITVHVLAIQTIVLKEQNIKKIVSHKIKLQ
jgi:hypothetical protein